ncbi:MAG: hypothetical protein R3A51_13030 [Nannocystaceae bacterium]|nr:hypothetical protein [Myxococcales bacterium]
MSFQSGNSHGRALRTLALLAPLACGGDTDQETTGGDTQGSTTEATTEATSETASTSEGETTAGTTDSTETGVETEGETDPPVEEQCGDALDNDDDGAIDCEDSDCVGAPDCTGEPGEHVASVELGAPVASEFVLRATIPLPPGVFPRADGKDALGVEDHDGAIVPAQVELVSRSPGGDGDVVELIARVAYDPASVNPGDRITYRVFELAHVQPSPPVDVDPPALLSAGPVDVPDAVAALTSAPGSIVLRSRDAFGHVYRRDLLQGSAKLMRHGSAAVEVRTHGALVPEDGAPQGAPDGALPHLMGAHAYASAWQGEAALRLDLRIHNAMSGHDKGDPEDDAAATIYYDALELVLPAGWTAVPSLDDPALGAPYSEGESTVIPIVAPQQDDTLHSLPPQWHFTRRLALVRAGDEAHGQELVHEAGLAYARAGQSETADLELYSWFNPETGHYFPQRHYMPLLDHLGGQQAIRDGLTADLANYAALVASGADTNANYPLVVGNQGPFHCWGVFYGGMTGGTEINPYDGELALASASNEGYRFMQLQHRMRSCRQHNRLYNLDGEHTAVEDWIVNGPQGDYVPIRIFNNLDLDWCGECDPFGFLQAPTYQADYALQQGLAPPYEATLVQYSVEDTQHLIRLLRTQLTLVWLGNDALARDDLMATAELTHLHLHDYPAFFYNGEPKTNGSSLLDIRPTTPGQGVFWGRGEWWQQFSMTGAYAIADDAWRAKKRGWFNYVVDELLLRGVIPCTGYIGVAVNKNTDYNYRSRRGNEAAFGDHVMLATLRSVYAGVDPDREAKLRDLIEQSTYASILEGYSWDDMQAAPYIEMPTAPAGDPSDLYCAFAELPVDAQGYATGSGPNRIELMMPLIYGYELTGDAVFLQRAEDIMSYWSNQSGLQAQIEDEGENLLNYRLPLLACLQRGLCSAP